jgi:hypothetical protein
MSQYWKAERTKDGYPVAVLYDEKKVIAKIYLSPTSEVLRLVLAELSDASQLRIDVDNHIIDFRRKATKEW